MTSSLVYQHAIEGPALLEYHLRLLQVVIRGSHAKALTLIGFVQSYISSLHSVSASYSSYWTQNQKQHHT